MKCPRTATQNLAFTFSNGGRAGNGVIATRLASGKALASGLSATTLVSTMPWLPYATKWRKLASPELCHTVSFNALCQTQTREFPHGKEVQPVDNSN
jgi:hypothetical protein